MDLKTTTIVNMFDHFPYYCCWPRSFTTKWPCYQKSELWLVLSSRSNTVLQVDTLLWRLNLAVSTDLREPWSFSGHLVCRNNFILEYLFILLSKHGRSLCRPSSLRFHSQNISGSWLWDLLWLLSRAGSMVNYQWTCISDNSPFLQYVLPNWCYLLQIT